MKRATTRLITIPNFFTILSSRLIDRPTRASGMAINQGIFERIANRKFVRRKAAEISPAEKPTMILALRDLIKISVNATSWYHNQSVIKEIMLEKKIKKRAVIPKNVQEKNLVMFIQKNQPILSWPVLI